ncbi:hypothetical protein AK88_05298 [Plasmodium fragile]|uniref:Schizont-infected cell agglutination C-terminal domain-containing protein n=1 Tax=Plasmodium fragile TaxID=5857 RepID=A0A0D9QHA0_PLAFR|nr:uncharacterized protein AK88_05298 [Plasmodium fragile]KJP85076.1 hypothetical protein AK88_05298 [Plasmodium fragile]
MNLHSLQSYIHTPTPQSQTHPHVRILSPKSQTYPHVKQSQTDTHVLILSPTSHNHQAPPDITDIPTHDIVTDIPTCEDPKPEIRDIPTRDAVRDRPSCDAVTDRHTCNDLTDSPTCDTVTHTTTSEDPKPDITDIPTYSPTCDTVTHIPTCEDPKPEITQPPGSEMKKDAWKQWVAQLHRQMSVFSEEEWFQHLLHHVEEATVPEKGEVPGVEKGIEVEQVLAAEHILRVRDVPRHKPLHEQYYQQKHLISKLWMLLLASVIEECEIESSMQEKELYVDDLLAKL